MTVVLKGQGAVRMTRHPLGVRVVEAGQLPRPPGLHVVGPDIHGPVTIGEKVDGLAHPDREAVGGPLVGEPRLLERLQIQDGEGGVLPTPVAPPLPVPAAHPVHDDAGPVG